MKLLKQFWNWLINKQPEEEITSEYVVVEKLPRPVIPERRKKQRERRKSE